MSYIYDDHMLLSDVKKEEELVVKDFLLKAEKFIFSHEFLYDVAYFGEYKYND